MAKRFYLNETGNAGPSPAIWGNCPVLDMMLDPRVGYYLFDDFTQFLEDTGGWLVAGTNDTCVIPADELGGVIRVGSTGADNDEGYLTSGNNEGGCCRIYTTTPAELWFEARVRSTSVTDQGLFIGLAEEGLAAADTLQNNTAALAAAADFVGFHTDTAAPTVMDAVYQTGAAAPVVAKASAQVIALGTWYCLGMHFDGTYLNWYVNGVREPLTAAVTGVVLGEGLQVSAATNFPDGEELAILIGVHDGEGAAKSIDIDWVRLAQRR